jgi:polar amino acid transport system substrate-binding protein
MMLFLSAGTVLPAAEYLILALQYPPYEYQDARTGEVKGIAADMVRQAFARMGDTVTIRVLPWPRILWMVKTGQADGFFTAYRTPDREDWADYSREELVPQVTSLFARKGAGIAFRNDFPHLAGLSIGVVGSVSYGERFDRAVRDKVLPRILESVDGETNFRQLFAGRVDLVASNRLGAKYILAQMGRTGQAEELTPPLERLPSYLALSRKKNLVPLRDRFDQALAEMKADGTWACLLKQGGN